MTAFTSSSRLHRLRNAALVVGSVWLCSAGLSDARAQSAAPMPTATIALHAAGGVSFLDGVIQPVKQSTVSAQASGRIASFVVKAGDKVRAGQLLATIDDREASVAQQRSQAQVDQAQAELRNAQAQYTRTRDLQAQGYVSRAALDTAAAQLESAQAQNAQASAATRMSGLAQSFTKVSAPFDGWVLQTDAQVGDLAVPGKPLLVIYAPVPMRAVVQVPASRAAFIHQATQVQVEHIHPSAVLASGEDDSSTWVTPSARSLVPSSDPVSQTTEWRLELPAAHSAAWVPGQQVRVKFTTASGANRQVLAVPQAAIVRRGELTGVYVQTGSHFSLRAVRLGASLGEGLTQVLAGLRAGDVVALDPLRAVQAPAAAASTR